MALNRGSTAEGETYVELYVRSLSPRGANGRQVDAMERLEELFQSGALSEYDVHVCGERLPATPAETRTEFGTYLLNRIAVFEQWAWHNNLSLDSTFERRHVESTVTDETYSEIVMPTVALAEYRGDALRFVAPATTDRGETISVLNRLTTLAEQSADSGRVDSLPDAHTKPPENRPRTLTRQG